ncbi:MAG: sugar transferase [Coriobacteriia bacterium]
MAQERIKRLVDVVAALIVLVVFFPLWIAVAVLVVATSAGPVLFLQDRPGRYGQAFKILKFRTMRPGSDTMIKGQEVASDDERVTTLGRLLRRTKIDEIPQVLNVLKGEMSLVGPRPERMASLDEYTDEIAKRMNVRPGMTGLAQVSGNIHLPLHKRYALDAYYAEHWSMALDLKIVLRTVGVILFGEGRYIDRSLVDLGAGTEARVM